MKTTHALLSLTSLSATAYASIDSTMGLGTPSDSSLAGLSSSPNASGTATTNGLNLSISTTSSVTNTDWHLQNNVTELTNSDVSSISSGQAVTYSQLGISYTGVASLPANGTTWNVCALIIHDLYTNATVSGQNDDGSCKATLGSDCIEAMTSAIMAANPVGRGCSVNPAVPVACNGSIKDSAMTFFELDPKNTSVLYTTSALHDASNLTTYDVAVTAVTPIVLYFQANSTNVTSPGAISGQANMGCVRAGNVSAGSEAVTSVPGSKSGGSSKKGGAVAVGISYAAVVVGLGAGFGIGIGIGLV